MMDLPTRLILCVDGASCDTSPSSIETNVHRIYASIQRGTCTDSSSGVIFNQTVTYIAGHSLANDVISKDRLRTGLLGQSCLKQIQEIYYLCTQLSHEKDEVWLFGFGRGAFVVRAVAGLLHTFGAVAPPNQAEKAIDFKERLMGMQAQRIRADC